MRRSQNVNVINQRACELDEIFEFKQQYTFW